MASRRGIIRVGDQVRVIKPLVVVRVGYPKTVSDYEGRARELFGPGLWAELRKQGLVDKVIREIAYGLAKVDGFGGRQRSLHTLEIPDLRGMEFRVSQVRSVKTGTYYPPTTSRHWEYGDSDYELGGLANEKTVRLVRAAHFMGHTMSLKDMPEFATDCLEKVAPTS